MASAEAEALYLKLFPQGAGDAVARLIESHQSKESRIIEEWRAICAESFGAHHALSEQMFQKIYVPGLRYAYLCLWRRDAPALIAFARNLGEQLARVRVPFAAFVAYLHFLRRSYAKVLADEPNELPGALAHIDAVHAYLVSVVADAYFEREPAPPEPSRAADATPDGIHTVFHGMVGRSPAMQRLFDKMARIAASGSPVLVLGETGTGKELVARAIHRCGANPDGPFVAVNCAALPRELFESELFGYRRGAFSGAVTECVGLFRSASGGTLLLDEVTEMAPELQAKLLRVLQDKVVRPVGSVTEIPIDVRVIASSNRDPEEAMASRVLRPDLYYRLSSSTIALPPLRARREDVPALVEYWLRRSEEQRGLPRGALHVTLGYMDMLMAQPWPGNVRELFNVLTEALAMSPDGRIGVDPLPRAASARSEAEPAAETPSTLEAAERDVIERTLRATGGNRVRAARQLGISRTQLYVKMTKYGLAECAHAPSPRRRHASGS